MWTPPLPTPMQVQYQHTDIMALIHFNMATFFENGDPGCTPENWAESQDPLAFDPTELDIDQWADSMDALNITSAVLTAKHGCGFDIWPTNVTLPDGSTTYPYAVSPSLDVIKEFSETMERRNIGHGYYYSLTTNFYLNVCHMKAGTCVDGPPLPGQHPVTQEEFESIAIAQLAELWTQYGNLTEIWFDGGYSGSLREPLLDLLSRHQPDVVAMNSGGLIDNSVRWVGTEGSMEPIQYPQGVWCNFCCNSTGTADDVCVVNIAECDLNVDVPGEYTTYGGAGCIGQGCDLYSPAGLDFTLLDNDVWFWEPDLPLRSLETMIYTYHNSVGRNTVMELAFSIDRRGKVDDEHAKLYKAFGDWIHDCYGHPVVSKGGKGEGEGEGEGYEIEIDVGNTEVDRVMIREDVQYGQRIKSFSVTDQDSNTIASGDSIGNKRIEIFEGGVKGKITLKVVGMDEENYPPRILSFAAYQPCPSS